jgi:ligand-binding sensor domain-containing protein
MRFWLTGVFLIVILLQNAMAQDPVYRQITGRNGLPSSEVYDVLQDEKGYLWFSTDHGLARYDGYRFMIFDESSGLPENTVFDLEIDASGRIWVNTIRGHFAYLVDEKVVAFPYNHLLDSLLADYPGNFKIFDSYHVDSLNNLLINVPGKGLLEISEVGNYRWLKKQEFQHFYELILLDNNKLLKQNATINGSNQVVFFSDNDTLQFEIEENREAFQRSVWRSLWCDQALLVSFNNKLYQIDKHGRIEHKLEMESNIHAMIVDKEGDLWVGTASNGVYKFLSSDISAKPKNYFSNISVSEFYIDNENGLWITSLNKGVFHIPIFGNHFYSRKAGFDFENVNDVVSELDGSLWLALSRGRLGRISASGEQHIFQLDTTNDLLIEDIDFDHQSKVLWVGTSEKVFKVKWLGFQSEKKAEVKHLDFLSQGAKSVFFKDESVLLGHFASFSKVDSDTDSLLYTGYQDAFIDRVEDITLIGDQVFLATLNGVWLFHNDTVMPMGDKFPLLGLRATQLAAAGDTLLVGTKGSGLLMLADDSLSQFTQQDGLASNSVTAIEVRGNMIYVGTNTGLSLIDRTAIGQQGFIQTFDVHSGMFSNEINNLDFYNDQLYLATADGLQVVYEDAFKHSGIHLPIFITDVIVSHNDFPFEKKITLPFNQNNIQLDYFALSFRNKGRQTYRHRMLGLQDEWVVNQKTSAQYPYLPAGLYVFEVSVQNGAGEWNPEPARLEIVILKPFYLELWFILLAALLVALMISLVFFWRIRLVKQRNQLIFDLNWFQQEALINQMNPHFLFNSLNTVHRYVLQNDRMASSRYLTKFATLMRKILDMSQEKSLTIAKEVEALQLYLELESARFKDKFQFTVQVDPDIPQEQVKIPVFIIQPIVENAIWHGLMHSDKPGLIEINFDRISTYNLKVSIRDNGIGREEAERLRALNKPDQRKSLGLTIIKRRISLINMQEKTNIQILYNDLKSADGSCSGTEVIVFFPNFLKTFSHGTI